MKRSGLYLGSIVLCTMTATACSRELIVETAQPEQQGGLELTTPAPPAQTAAEPSAAPVWPDGWLFISDQEWLPVLDETGKYLLSAREYFASGDSAGAASQTRDAVGAIRRQEPPCDARERASLEQEAQKLEQLAMRLELRQDVSAAELTTTIAAAYRNTAMVTWLHLDDETWHATLQKPQRHFERALALLSKRSGSDAADEIRRGAGYLRLAPAGARADELRTLEQQVAKLTWLAQRADLDDLSAAELHTTLVGVDAAHAASYLQQAEREYEAKQAAKASRTLRQAAARLRARRHWLGEDVQRASSAVADELELLADKLGRGVSLTLPRLKQSLQRAREELRPRKPGSFASAAMRGG